MSRIRLPALGERAKLTGVYAGLLILICLTLIVVVYFLLRQSLPVGIGDAVASAALASATHAPTQVGGFSPQSNSVLTPDPEQNSTAIVSALPILATQTALDSYLSAAIITLVVLATLSVLIAWWLAGRVLRPVAMMAHAARMMSVTDLSQRIELDAPPGELKQLADTFDQLLDRIDSLVSSQQRFVANAAHELRTQLAVQRSAAEIGLADPTPDRVERIRNKLLQSADENERLLEGLLLLAVTDQGLQHSDPISVEQLVVLVMDELAVTAEARDVQIRTNFRPLVVQGERVLLKHLVHNLMINAINYNDSAGGLITVRTSSSELVVSNTGPTIDPDQVAGLFEPFRRLNPRQHRAGEGAGLGLAIVSSIAKAHNAKVTAEANTAGGLTVRVLF